MINPCPFCGSESKRVDIREYEDHPHYGGSVIECTKCFASTRVFFGDKEGLEEAWNDRTSGSVFTRDEINAIIEYLENLVEKLEGKNMQIDDIERNFTYYPPKNAEQVKKYQDIRTFAKTFAMMLVNEVPYSSELDKAIEKIQEVVFWANAGIARHE